MLTRVKIEATDTGYSIFEALTGKALKEGIATKKKCLKIVAENQYELPPLNKNGDFFADLAGAPLFLSRPAKTEDVELEYADSAPCLDFEMCNSCGGPAFGRDTGAHNCYFCPICKIDIDCVPMAEDIGAMD